MDNETSWGRAEIVDLASERIRRRLSTLRRVELWAEPAAEESAVAPMGRGCVEAASLALARVEGSQSAYTEVAARMAAYQRAVAGYEPDVRVILAAERAWCEAERDASRTAVRLVDGEESDHALGRAAGFDVVARRIGGLLKRHIVSPTTSAASVPAWRAWQ